MVNENENEKTADEAAEVDRETAATEVDDATKVDEATGAEVDATAEADAVTEVDVAAEVDATSEAEADGKAPTVAARLVAGAAKVGRSVASGASDARDAALAVADAVGSAGHAAKKATTHVVDAFRRVRDGYDGYDIWEFGDQLTAHVAEATMAAADAGLLSDHEFTADEARDHAARLFLFNDADFGTMLAEVSDARVDEVASRSEAIIEEKIREEWNWLGEHVLSGDMSQPVEKKEKGRFGWVDDLARSLTETASRVAKKPYADRAFPVSELRRICSMLEDYAGSSIGYTIGYADGIDHLFDAKEGWETQPISVNALFIANSEVVTKVKPLANGRSMLASPTPEEIGVDYAATLMDISCAVRSISAWASWTAGRLGIEPAGSGNPYAALATMVAESPDGEAKPMFDNLEVVLRENYVAAWHWLGQALPGLWL